MNRRQHSDYVARTVQQHKTNGTWDTLTNEQKIQQGLVHYDDLTEEQKRAL